MMAAMDDEDMLGSFLDACEDASVTTDGQAGGGPVADGDSEDEAGMVSLCT